MTVEENAPTRAEILDLLANNPSPQGRRTAIRNIMKNRGLEKQVDKILSDLESYEYGESKLNTPKKPLPPPNLN